MAVHEYATPPRGWQYVASGVSDPYEAPAAPTRAGAAARAGHLASWGCDYLGYDVAVVEKAHTFRRSLIGSTV